VEEVAELKILDRINRMDRMLPARLRRVRQ